MKYPSLTPEQQTEKDISALYDSLAVIDAISELANPTTDELDSLNRNLRHIEIMLAKPHIIESGADLSAFEAAVSTPNA
jgi:hypothetical protein